MSDPNDDLRGRRTATQHRRGPRRNYKHAFPDSRRPSNLPIPQRRIGYSDGVTTMPEQCARVSRSVARPHPVETYLYIPHVGGPDVQLAPLRNANQVSKTVFLPGKA
ncbi:hypothetical protein CLAIMM_08273 isoform 2 [Cladophialophora immunda]|nr:hypothetical protein CLAIMM_08273 isoform 1 [Cladophialophora immunda]OQV03198.1 hypothetical protein CLAIMM_08273 isoform 2 [Cladophialophora immunda]